MKGLTWIVPDDRGGGVVSVAQACCHQAVLAGHDATLLLLLPPTGHAAEFGGFHVESLALEPPYTYAPRRFFDWMTRHRPEIVLFNGCEEADVAIPHVPSGTRVIYVVHDTAPRYFSAALRHEASIDAVIAVSETVASCVRPLMRDPGKLRVALNGTVFPVALDVALSGRRQNDLVFLGGDKSIKGAFDAIALWSALYSKSFEGRLQWFGEVGEPLRAELNCLAGSERIILHGRTPRQKIFEVASRSRVLLMLSRVEPFGMATVECMGMGCLTAAWDIDTGTREIVSADEGVFAPLGDYDSLATGVLDLLGNHEHVYRDAAKRIRRTFDDAAMWQRYQDVFEWLEACDPVVRPLSSVPPPSYRPPVRLFQLLPAGLRDTIREIVGRSPRLGYWLRDLRGR